MSKLVHICTDLIQSPDTGLQADGLVKQMQQLESALMTVIWHTVLERFSATSLILQKVEIDLLNAVRLYDSLITFLFQTGQIIRDGREGFIC